MGIKRIILILVIILVVGTGLYVGRHYIFKSADVPETTQTENPPVPIATTPNPTEELPASQGATPLAAVTVFDYWVDQSDRTVYFISPDGSLDRMRAGGIPEEILSLGTGDLSSVQPAPVGTSALIEAGYPNDQFFSIVSPTTKTRQFLPLGTVAAAWSPDATQIAFIKEGEPLSLNIFTLATAKSRFLTSLNMVDLQLSWKTAREIYISQRPSTGVPGSLWAYDLAKKTIRTVSADLPGLTARWVAPAQALVFFNTNSGSGGTLAVLNGQTGSITALPVLTLPDKCAVEQSTAYCGVPNEASAVGFPSDYYQRKFYTTDNIVSVSMAGGGRTQTVFGGVAAGANIDAYHLIKVGSSLYFINLNDNRLYSVPL